MDWFTRLTGFPESTWSQTRAQLEVDGACLRAKSTGRKWRIGTFEMASLADLRERVAAGAGGSGRPHLSVVQGDVRQLHQEAEFAGALFQVASQFNALEMVGPSVTPEDGVTGYAHDHTQGPACAMACGAATIFRNYFVPVGGQAGQASQRQLDGLLDLGTELSRMLGRPVEELWTWRNGYALCTQTGLGLITNHLLAIGPEQTAALAGKLRIGVHRDVEVTDARHGDRPGPLVSQAFCSALPVAYSQVRAPDWQAFARLVLNAAYEATLLEAVLNARRGASNTVLLTLLGGGAFGNAPDWIFDAIGHAMRCVASHELDVRVVSCGPPAESLRNLAAAFS